jgi:hypothetical protein
MQDFLKLPQDLKDGLLLRWAKPADNDKLVSLAFAVLDEAEEAHPFVSILVNDWTEGKFPTLHHKDITVVEDTHTGQIVSPMCLFSDIWHYGSSPIKVGRPKLVMTHPDYRRRGLIRKQFYVIHNLSAQCGETMQVITGIPSFYRQFGYDLALDLGGGYRIYPPNFPKLSDDIVGDFSLRNPVSEADRTFVRKLHQTNTKSLLFSMAVPEPAWEFEFDGYTDGSDGKFHWLIIENKDGKPLGYLHHNHIFWSPVMDINFLYLTPEIGYLNLLPNLLKGLWDIAQRKFVDDTFEHFTDEIRGLHFQLGRDHPIYDAIGRDLDHPMPGMCVFQKKLLI